MSLKGFLKRTSIGLIGFPNYLVAHAFFVVATVRLRKEERDVERFIRLLPVDGFVLDIGANVGAMTLLFARRCPRGLVYGYEPIPQNRRAAQTVLRLARVRNARLFDFGLGDREETVQMIMPTYDGVPQEGLSFVAGERPPVQGTTYRVPLKRLDDLPELRQRRIDGIKIDVEDHERFVLRGAVETIKLHRPIIYCELWGGENKRECIEILQSLDYRLEYESSLNCLFVWEGARDSERSPSPASVPGSMMDRSRVVA